MKDEKLKAVVHGRTNVHIGKNGITPAIIDEVKNQIKLKKIIKVKFLDLHDFDSMDQAARILADQSKSKLVETRGHTCILRKS
jgi:RNA-binding protein